MPIYIFQCKKCSSKTEALLNISETLDFCSICGASHSFLKKIPTQFASLDANQKKDPEPSPFVENKTNTNPIKPQEHACSHKKDSKPHSCNQHYIDSLVKNYDNSLK